MRTENLTSIGPIGRIRLIGPIFATALALAFAASQIHAAEAPAKAPATPAAPAGALGEGLSYLRVREAPAGLADAPATARGALVLDLRFATAGADAGTALGSWLKSRARTEAPVLVLFNAATAQDLLAALSPATLPPGVITLAPSGASLAADLLIPVTPEADRAAYDAGAGGTPLERLIAVPSNKPRLDEAELIRRDALENAGKTAPPPPTTPPTRGGGRGRGGPGRENPPPLVDALLQRAVQVHRSLVALGRIK